MPQPTPADYLRAVADLADEHGLTINVVNVAARSILLTTRLPDGVVGVASQWCDSPGSVGYESRVWEGALGGFLVKCVEFRMVQA